MITALGVQARVAVREAGLPLAADFARLADTACAEALTAARVAFEGTGPWQGGVLRGAGVPQRPDFVTGEGTGPF